MGAVCGTAPDRLQFADRRRFAVHEEIIYPSELAKLILRLPTLS
jgi:hypothetical protein